MIYKFVDLYKRINELKNNFEIGKSYLRKGDYRFSKDSIVYNKDISNKNKILNFNNTIKGMIKNILIKALMLKCTLKKETNGKLFNGDILFLSGGKISNKKINIIDLKNNLILKKYKVRKGFNNDLKSYNYFSQCFSIPKLHKVYKEELILIQNYIEHKNYQNLNADNYDYIFNYILDEYTKYYKKTNEEKLAYIKLNDLWIKDKIYKDLRIKLLKSLEDKNVLNLSKVPYIFSHGDLTVRNVIMNDKAEIFFIDWERSKRHTFLYDLFYFIHSAYLINNDFHLFNNYLNGSFDNNFKILFKTFDMEYKKEYKKEYYYLFLLEYLSLKRKTKMNNDRKNKILAKEKEILSKIKEF